MNITLLQTNIKWADSVANRKAAEFALSVAQAADLYILPEMFSTGFATKPEGIAESNEETLQWMKEMAEKYDAAIAGSVAVKASDETFRNRFYFVKPNGETVFYDKRHLFSYGGEDKTYTKGTERKIVEWRGVKFLLQVCYDLRFPVFARNGMIGEGNAHDCEDATPSYDAIIYVANWPNTRRKVWDLLLHARAIENQCYVIGVNRVGDDLTCHYNGGSMVIDAYGKDVASVDDDMEGAVSVTLDLEKLQAFRKKFPVLYDAD